MRLQACLNGSHRPDVNRPVPVSPAELAAAARDAVRAGAEGVHVHPKGPDGADDVSPAVVGAAVDAVAAAVPGVEIGVTTGAWAAPSAAEREAAVRAWAGLPLRPDVASVNWHEEGSPALAAVLLDLGIGVEAGCGRRTRPGRSPGGRDAARRRACSSRRPGTTRTPRSSRSRGS